MLVKKTQQFPQFFSFNHWEECDEWRRSKDCKCNLVITGCHISTQGIKVEQSAYEGTRFIPRQERFFRILEKLEREVEVDFDGVPIRRITTEVFGQIKTAIVQSQNCRLIHAPIPFKRLPSATILPSLTPQVQEILYMTEKLYFSEMVLDSSGYKIQPFRNLPIHEYQSNVTSGGMKSLAQLAYEAASPLTWVRKGLVVSSTATLHEQGGDKLREIMTTYCRPVRGLQYKLGQLTHLFPKAIDFVTHICGSTAEIGKHDPEVDVGEITEGMYLDTAGGINGPQGKILGEEDGIPTELNYNGKKFEVLPAAIEQFVDFVLRDKRPFGNFTISVKEENAFMDHESDRERKQRKGRIFVIPNMIIILIEHIIGVVRKLEIGGSIGIGRTWTAGGMDALLKSLGILGHEDEYVLNEGDITKIDQSIPDVLINLFFSSRLQYFNPAGEDYEVAKKAVQFLIEEFTQKVTFLVGELWAVVCGGVPSGALHTSHMDSWCLLFLFVLFCLDVAEKNPAYKDEIELALLSKAVAIVVYGDDNWYFIKRGPLEPLLNAHALTKWLKEYVGMEMRDVRVGHSLVSLPHNGFFKVKGGVYLRHYCVRNPCSREGQPVYVPYRPMREIVLKTVYGREPKPRDAVSLVLSCLGHAYGTYGSNPFSYNWLWALYRSALLITGKPAEYFSDKFHVAEKDVLRKARQLNISLDQLREGFPTMYRLHEMNKYDVNVHSIGEMSLRAMLV